MAEVFMCPFCEKPFPLEPPQTCGGSFLDREHPSAAEPMLIEVDDRGVPDPGDIAAAKGRPVVTSPDYVRARVDALADRLAREYGSSSVKPPGDPRFRHARHYWVVMARNTYSGAMLEMRLTEEEGAFVAMSSSRGNARALMVALRAEGLI